MSRNLVEFKAPPGVVPEGKDKPGDQFEAVTTFQAKEGGTLCITKIGDVEMPGYGERSRNSRPAYPTPDKAPVI